MAYLWGFIGSLLAIGMELLFRKHHTGYANLLPYVVLPAMLMNYVIYKMVSSIDFYVNAFIIFSFCNLTLRILSSFLFLHEHLRPSIYVAYGFLVIAQVVRIL